MPVHDDPLMPRTPSTWDDSAFDLWSSIARLRYMQRRLVERVTHEATALRDAVDRHPTCGVELEQLRASIEQLAEVTDHLIDAHTNARPAIDR